MSSQNSGGSPREHDGFLESEDDLDELKLPSAVMHRTFQIGLWDRINRECGTCIEEYEGEWLEPIDLEKAAKVIRQSMSQEDVQSSLYVATLGKAVAMLEKCAGRGVRVMFSV